MAYRRIVKLKKLNCMAKKQKNFHVAITKTERHESNGVLQGFTSTEVLIYGIAYHYPAEADGEQYDYDIDEIYYNDKKTGFFVQIPLSVVEAIAGVDSIKDLDHFHYPCLKQAEEVFSKAHEEEIAAMDFDNTLIETL